MKASIKFREERQPLMRAKVPISIFSLPFLSGVVAALDDARNLRLDLATALDSGPTFRLSYRPNDARNPFALVLKTGVGAFGSPIGAPFAMTAEFSLLPRGSGSPAFSLLFKPRFGDFTVKSTVRSSSAAPTLPPGSAKFAPVGVDTDANGSGDGVVTRIVGLPPPNGIHDSGKSLNGFPTDITPSISGSAGGINGLLSGFEVSATSVLPLRNCAAIKFKWGLKAPTEVRSAFDGSTAGVPLGKLPLLAMSKISIEHVTENQKKKRNKADIVVGAAELVEACSMVKRQLEVLQSENGMLRRAVEELRMDVGGWKSAPLLSGSRSETNKSGTKVVPPAAVRNRDRDKNTLANVEKVEVTAAEDVNEELKKALMAAASKGSRP